MSTPTTSKSPNKKLFFAIVFTVVPLGLLLLPPILYGGFLVPVSAVTFNETTGSLTYTNAQATVETKTAWEYMLIKSGGMVRTTETDVSSSRGTATITMSLRLTTPSNQTLSLGNINISGAMGTRTHTIYVGADEGVRLPGSYKLNIDITAQVAPVVGIETTLTVTVTVNFTVA